MAKTRASAEVRALREQSETLLRLNGWWQSDCGWRHRSLGFAWPLQYALQLERDAEDEGHRRACSVCRELVEGRVA